AFAFRMQPRWANPERGRDEYGLYTPLSFSNVYILPKGQLFMKKEIHSPPTVFSSRPHVSHSQRTRQHDAAETPSHLASSNFRWPLDKLGQILLDPVRCSPIRFLRPSLILKDADCNDDIVPCIYAIIRDKSWDLSHERHEALLGTSCELINRACLGLVPT